MEGRSQGGYGYNQRGVGAVTGREQLQRGVTGAGTGQRGGGSYSYSEGKRDTGWSLWHPAIIIYKVNVKG